MCWSTAGGDTMEGGEEAREERTDLRGPSELTN